MVFNKKAIIVGILLLWLLPLIVSGTEYTPSSDTTCDSQGKCTLTQYSGVVFVQEDDRWKYFEDARSLKDKGFDVKYIEEDKDYVLDVLDFNATSITLNLNPDGIVFLNKEIPLRIWTEDKITPTEEKVYTGDFKQDYLKTEESLVDFNILKQSETLTLDAKLGDIIEFGPNSTTIVLQASGTGNIKDAYLDQANPNTNFGTGGGIFLGVITNKTILITFNLTSLPDSGINIFNASLILNWNSNNLDAGETMNTSASYTFLNYSWTESGVTYNTRPIINENFSSIIKSPVVTETSFGSQGIGQNTTWNVTSLINQAYLNSENEINMYLEAYNPTGGIDATDTMHYASRTDSTPTQAPILKIMYDDISLTSCTYTSGNWDINAADNCTITSNVNLGKNNITINNFGVLLVNAANITNYTKLNLNGASTSSQVIVRNINGGGFKG